MGNFEIHDGVIKRNAYFNTKSLIFTLKTYDRIYSID